MWLRNASIFKPLIAVLAVTMLVVALACASDEATPTNPPATSPPPTATSSSMTDGQPTATPVMAPDTDIAWMDRYLQSPGYDPEWGQPIKGGTFIFGAQRDGTRFNLAATHCCYSHGCYSGLPINSLFRVDAWTGDLRTIEGDLVESWDMSEDALTLTMKLREGVMYQDIHPKSPIPAEYNGGKIAGDEFVCEDAKASIERFAWTPPRGRPGYSRSIQVRRRSCTWR